MATAPLWSSSPSTSGRAGALGQDTGRRVSDQSRPPLPPREFRFTSEVPVWLDYHGKHVSMDQVVRGAMGRVATRAGSFLGSLFCPGMAWSLGCRA